MPERGIPFRHLQKKEVFGYEVTEKKKHHTGIRDILRDHHHSIKHRGSDPALFAGGLYGEAFVFGVCLYRDQTQSFVRLFCQYIHGIHCVPDQCGDGTDPGLGAGAL